jgi:SAM-dependent MidA family methyltransferase
VLENRDGGLLEQFVTLDSSGELSLTGLPPSNPELPAFLSQAQIDLQPGERIEINVAVNAWLTDLSGIFDRGVVTIIDYGDLAPARYSPARREGTLLAYYAGAVTDDLLARPGQQDLTALVDFTALQTASIQAGFDIVAMTRQANFLLGLGLGTALTSDSYAGSLQDALEYRRGMQALVSMEGLGRFHVLLLSKGLSRDQAASLAALRYASL